VTLELFTAQGYDATSVRQIAAKAAVKQMSFFRHFRAKEPARAGASKAVAAAQPRVEWAK
jgi:AcrR family transcriptional regulator